MYIIIPEFCLVLLIGISGSGKSSFANRHFKATEVISFDHCRALVTDNETDETASAEALTIVCELIHMRLTHKKLTVIDALNINLQHRKKLMEIAKDLNCQVCAIVFNYPLEICYQHIVDNSGHGIEQSLLLEQYLKFEKTLLAIQREEFYSVAMINSPDEANNMAMIRELLTCNKSEESGPFDIIGDIHGCYEELTELLGILGYEIYPELIESPQSAVKAPQQRRVIFLGDLVDRGPNSTAVLKLVMNMVKHRVALCVPGNHDKKLLNYLLGKKVQLTHGLEITANEFTLASSEFKKQVCDFLGSLVSHYVLDKGNLVVAHAGMKAEFQGRISSRVEAFALYGETTGEFDEFGLPKRQDWSQHYQGNALVVYGHTATDRLQWVNNTICIDTGCVFGGYLTALRYPEKDYVSVTAKKCYYFRTHR